MSWPGTEPVRPLRMQGGLRYSESPSGAFIIILNSQTFASGVKMIKTPKWRTEGGLGAGRTCRERSPGLWGGVGGAQHVEWAPLGASGAGRRHPHAEAHPGKGAGVNKLSTTTGWL